MFNSLMLGVALTMGQTPAQAPRPYYQNTSFHSYQQAVQGQPVQAQPAHGSCFDGHGCEPCRVEWLKRWKCEDLEMKPVERKCRTCGFFHSLLWCPEEEEEAKNGNGEAKNGNGEKKNGEKRNEAEEKKNGEPEAEADPDRTPLMQLIYCRLPGLYDRMEHRGVKVYGWVWAGFTANFASPDDRINFGTNYNWRANDVRLDQVYFALEKAVDHGKQEAQLGYRVDFYTGHQAPFMVANGLFSSFTGFNPTSGYGSEGPASFRELNRIGIDLPQFYVNAHIPNIITEKGIDVLVGRFWTLMGYEVYPAPLTRFYSHSYEIIHATPFTHTGVLGTLHATDTWDVTAGVIQGADVFEDNNRSPSFIGNFVWNSCDKRWNWTTAWITGPEQFNNNSNNRTLVTSNVTSNFGHRNEWQFVFAGHLGLENNAVADPVTGAANDAEWYGVSSYLFYTVDPRLILGSRLEWSRDDDGARTALTRRPGFAANFYGATLNATYNPFQNLRLRPELRFDWSDGPAVDGSGSRPFNDLRDRFQTTAAFDVIWQF